ncbi:MAG: GTP-binding protein [Promethearchaeota archaeon]
MSRIATLNDLLANLLNSIPDLKAALIVDLEGLVIAQQSIKGFDEDIIGAIMSIIEKTISKIKKFADTSYGSGSIDTNDFQLFYVELGGSNPALFVLVADLYAKLSQFISYSYIVAEKASRILNAQKVNISLPLITPEGKLRLKSNNNIERSKQIINKIIITGAEAVGKSSLVNMYINGIPEDSYKPTIGVSIVKKELQVTKNIAVTFYLFDFGGLKSFAKVRKNFYDESKAVIILFDCSRSETFDQIPEWIAEAQHFIKDKTVSYILVGNKIDLVEDRDNIINKATKLAVQYDYPFFITSSITGEGLDELFMYLLNIGSNQV